MHEAMQVAAVLLVAFAIAPAIAHALELPGKRQLNEEQYRTGQKIHYPGFTIAGLAEPLAVLQSFALIIVTPGGQWAFWLMVGAFILLLAMHALYWMLTRPVKRQWQQNGPAFGAGRTCFDANPIGRRGDPPAADWMELRERWEASHLARAILGAAGLFFLVTAVALHTPPK